MAGVRPRALRGDDPKELSEQLADEARRRRTDGHEDDITVIVLMLERGI